MKERESYDAEVLAIFMPKKNVGAAAELAYNRGVRFNEQNVRIKGVRMSKVLGSVMLLLGVSSALMAQAAAPEIDGSTGASALALLAGVVLVFQSRRKK